MAVPKIATLDEKDNGVAGLCECGYNSRGWPNSKIARERIEQHLHEHVKGVLMEPLEKFRERHGLVQDTTNTMRAVFPEGAKEIKTKIKDEES